ncbi:MAG: hypothetical protein CMN54_11695 [SAR324 cluster bacterium]|uniref:Uncharacterized protein n=1 Tax=SAR324 cluster bacterium TaxID=2024889 RepID=A0A2D6YLS2_9DELT|nr:hypothetical protein [SAR324 cluster bacterium]
MKPSQEQTFQVSLGVTALPRWSTQAIVILQAFPELAPVGVFSVQIIAFGGVSGNKLHSSAQALRGG